MPKSKTKTEQAVVIYPPRIAISPLSNKYDMIFNILWGDFSKDIKINLEEGGMWNKIINEINLALLEGSEAKPYIQK